jgi:hypothetical protein
MEELHPLALEHQRDLQLLSDRVIPGGLGHRPEVRAE